MKRLLIVVFILSFLKIVMAQSNDTLEYKIFYYANGVVSSQGYMKQGKPEGYWKTFSENGILKSEGNRKDFELDSLWKFYNDSGKVVLEINYSKGLKQGLRKSYNEIEIVEENFDNNVLNGYTRHFYTDGILKKELLFVNGRETGISKEYSREGLVLVITEYKNGTIIRRENINRTDRYGNKQGVWKNFYPDGALKDEGFYVTGKRNGYFKEYTQDGTLKKISKYVDDLVQEDVPELASYDIKTDYYPNGTPKVVGSYKNGIPEGIRREYDMNGNIENSYVFEKGKITGEGIVDGKGFKQGPWKEYYENGVVNAEGSYENSVRKGKWTFYTENGKIKLVGKFNKKGFQTGEWIWYHENKKVQKIENFSNGILQGLVEEYDEEGNLIAKGLYEEGNEDGPWIVVVNNYRQEGTYSYGRRNGVWKHYYDNGQLKFEGNFLDDYPDGKHVFYWENGKIKEERYYIMGKPEGTWRKYDEFGALLIYTDYKRGYEYRYDGIIIKPIMDE